MSSMIKRVAKAIDPMPWSDLAEQTWHVGALWKARAEAIKQARAAIEAMREPTDEMVKAFISEADSQDIAFDDFSPPQYPAPIYRAMIDAVLSYAPSTPTTPISRKERT